MAGASVRGPDKWGVAQVGSASAPGSAGAPWPGSVSAPGSGGAPGGAPGSVKFSILRVTAGRR